MTTHRVTATRRIKAPAPVAYNIIADYRDGHPHIIPPKWLRNLRVESGGIGDGTVISFDVRVLGTNHVTRGRVAEPSPGRVLTEHYEETGALTAFTVDPVKDVPACDVTITTDLKVHGGLLGALERAFMTRFLHRMYAEELALLDGVARARSPV